MSLRRVVQGAVVSLALWAAAAILHGQEAAAPAWTVLSHPEGVAVDRTSGDIYFAERTGNRIRRLTASGVLQTVAGNGTQGSGGDGGPAVAAQLNAPQGIALTPAGDLYIADSGNNRIRLVSARSGTIATVAGTGAAAFSGDGGPALQAGCARPIALALDSTGNLALLDSGNRRIRVITPAGTITTVLGDGTQGATATGVAGTATSLNNPSGLAFDTAGNLYVADAGNRTIVSLDVAGHLVRALSGLAGSAIVSPSALAVDDQGNLIILDRATHRVFRWSPQTGNVSVIAGSGTQGFRGDGSDASIAAINEPAGVAAGPNGLLVLADTGNNRIRALTPAGSLRVIQTLAGQDAPAPPLLSLSAASTTEYGSGSVQVSINSMIPGNSAASGTVTLRDTTGGVNTVVSQMPMVQGSATLPLDALAAGNHELVASYSGDDVHPASSSTPVTVVVKPRVVTATPVSTVMLYGQDVPAVGGSLSGVLARDATRVQASFSAAVSKTSPPGLYPVQVALAGLGALNYTLQSSPATLTVSRAPSVVSLSVDPSGGNTLLAKVTSTTTGVPSGSVTLYDHGSPEGSAPISAQGLWSIDTSQFSSGAHHLQAIYQGDPNFLSSTSPPLDWDVQNPGSAPTPEADFTLTLANGPAEIDVTAGDTAAVSLVMRSVRGQLSGPVALSVSGLPSYAVGNFDPPVLPPGDPSTPFTLHIVTAPLARVHHDHSPLLPLLALLFPLASFRCRRQVRGWCLSLGSLLALVAITGCGDRIGTTAGTPEASVSTYSLLVTGTATGADGTLLQHSIALTLRMQR